MFAHLKIYQRLLLVVAPFLLPIFLLLYSVSDTIDANIHFATDEVAGNAVLRPMVSMLHEVATIRGLSGTLAERAEQRQRHITEVDSAFAALAPLHDRYQDTLELEGEGLAKRGREHLSLAAMKAQWEALKDDYASAGKDDKAEAAMIANLRGWIAHAGDTSNLILDPDLDSYYTMDVTLLALPQALDRLPSAKAFVMDYARTPLQATVNDQTEIAVLARMIQEADHDRIVASLSTALSEDANFYGISPSFEKTLKPLLEEYSAKNTALVKLLTRMARGELIPTAKIERHFAEADAAAYALFTAAINELDVLLNIRIASYEGDKLRILGQGIVTLLIACVIFYFVFRSISVPLSALRETMSHISHGQLDDPVPYTGRKDEIGEMAESIEKLRQNSLHEKALEKEQQDERTRKEARSHKLQELNLLFSTQASQAISVIASAATQLYQACEALNQIVATADHLSGDIGRSSQITSSNVQTVASAAEEMSASIKEISTQLNNSMDITRSAVEEAQRADKSAQHMHEVSTSIGNVTSLIQEIANQINLLSLNATIESARAGEAGKGFAVVASEVKHLAGQTSKATEEIAGQITSVQGVSNEMNDVLRLVKSAVEKVDYFNSSIASAVEQQTAVTNEIVGNMHHATDSIQVINDNIQKISHNTSQASAAVAQVLTASKMLSQQAEILKQQVNDYIEDIQTL